MRGALALALLLPITIAVAKEPELKTSPLAQAFGSAPAMWGAKLSPDGSKVSFIRMHEQGATVAVVLDMVTGKARVILGGDRDRFDITWCDWVNSERLLCGLRGVVLDPPSAYALTRLVAVNHDSSNMKVLMDYRLRDTFAQFQDRVVDWLPDDDRHVLVQVPSEDGTGVSRLDVYAGDLVTEEHVRGSTYEWVSDGHGVPRLYHVFTTTEQRWDVREKPEQDAAWSTLHGARLEDADDTFSPIGFAENRNELLYLDRHEGREALFGMDLANDRQTRLIYAHPTVDVSSVLSFGKYRRLVAAAYVTDRPHLQFFDRRVADIHALLSRTLPNKQISVFDEDWGQRYYLVHAGSDLDSGTYYRFDAEKRELVPISSAYPTLKGRQLVPMREIHYPAKDGTQIQAYLTLPAGDASGHKPTIILPHGGPSARDYESYDFLVQFLAANGYAVLQSNYRGSGGYGEEWQGTGAFRNWRVAVGDIIDGADHLVREGIADPDRICAIGWSYGGYAALMSAIEQPKRFRCVVSIAGVSDPLELGFNVRRFVGGRTEQVFIGVGDEAKAGSPKQRAAELAAPVLLAHGQRDINVPFAQSQSLARSLTRAKKDVQFIEYEFAQHSIEQERYRIDLLTRVGDFLGQHLSAR
jgi:dipeptidyl aminopeptidase/acylaminoacyl peptidase